MRNMKNSILEEPLIHLRIWILNDVVMNEEDDEAKRRSILFGYAFAYILFMCYS